ncbi:MAG: helix-turn-helix domain-containing protein [Spirochaetes bacterium]|nr:helix-turn-helix domain-containing protein [Spirochaetota bacterium]
MNKQNEEVLQYLFDHTDSKKFVQTGELETQFGISPSALRNCIEDLKEKIYVFESEYGIQISESGINYAKSRWV